jgi:hypothetical protein
LVGIGRYVGNFAFDEVDPIRFTNGHTFADGRIEFRTAPEEPWLLSEARTGSLKI